VTRVVLAAAVAALVLVPGAAALTPGHATVRLTATELSANHPPKRVGALTVVTMHLFNKAVRPGALGSAVMACTYLGAGGVLGPGRSDCSTTFTLPRGTILARGQIATRLFFQMVVVGGTGLYANVHGTVIGSTSGVQRMSLLFLLQAF
jgi:hypothetical protein